MFKLESITKGGGKSAEAKTAAYQRYLARTKGKSGPAPTETKATGGQKFTPSGPR